MEGKGWLVRRLEKAWAGDRSGNAFDGGRMKEQSAIVEPNLFAIPRFFTFFSHFLELHRIECFETEERE